MRKRRHFFWWILPIIFAILTGVVMVLWNALLPQIIHVESISYIQSGGLLILCRILFGHWGPPRRSGNGVPGRPNWGPKRMNLSDEDRQRLKEEWKRRCGNRGFQ